MTPSDTPPVGGDWVLVPREPTDEMLQACDLALTSWRQTLSRDEAMARSYVAHDRKFKASATPFEKHSIRYRAMLSAAPPPPVGDREAVARIIESAIADSVDGDSDDAIQDATDAILRLLGLSPVVARQGYYVASRASVLARGEMWRTYRAAGVPIISTWIDEDGPNDTAELDELWIRIRHEVTSSARLVLYVEPEDFPLKGAFVEIGMALAAGIPITIVAPKVEVSGRNQRPFGSWIKHPSVSFATTVCEAFGLSPSLSPGELALADPLPPERCVCGCSSFARMDESAPGGGFRKGRQFRCVQCKREHDERHTGSEPSGAGGL